MSDNTEITIVESVTELTIADEEGTAAVLVGDTTIIEQPAGVPGPQGASSADVVRTAAATINGHRAVMVSAAGQVVHVDPSAEDNADHVLGVSIGAASQGASATIRTHGVLDESGWSWTPLAPVYVTTDGQLTQTPPASPAVAFLLRIGFAETPTRLFISLGEPLYL